MKLSRKISSNKKKMDKVLGIIVCILLLILINLRPTFSLKTNNMSKLKGKWVTVYYETEEEAAKDVFQYADSEIENIVSLLGIKNKQDVNIYIYDSQNTMHTKKYGYIYRLLNIDWYIGDNIGTNVILTSPANPGPIHDYNSVKEAVLHEVVHAYIDTKNTAVQLWLTEGIALYLTNGELFNREYYEDMKIPTYSDTRSQNPIRFSNCGGYIFAHTYIEYINKRYGWNKVLQLLYTEDYRKIFGKSDKEIYEEWVDYINEYGINNQKNTDFIEPYTKYSKVYYCYYNPIEVAHY